MIRMRKMVFAIPMVLSLSLAGVVAPAVTGIGSVQAATKVEIQSAKWLKIDKVHKTLTVKVIANATNANSGMNFDGYSNGDMQIQIPQGWLVQVSFQNHSSMMPHSAMIVPLNQHSKVSGFTPAFPRASTPSPTSGTMQGMTLLFKFKANKSGKFALICGLPGHSAGGMWDKVTVSSKFKTPSVMVTKDNSSSKSDAVGYGY